MTAHNHDPAEVLRRLTSMTPEQIREEVERVRVASAQYDDAEEVNDWLYPCTED